VRALYERALDDGSVHQLTEGPDDLAPDVSPEGETVLFIRDVTSIAVYAGDTNPRDTRRLTTDIENVDYVLPTRDGTTLVAPRVGAGTSDVIAIDVATGAERPIHPGRVPFPSRDGTRVLFVALGDPQELWSAPLVGREPARRVARLPGPIFVGTDAADGAHVGIQIAGHDAGWVVRPDGSVADEGAGGLVVPSPGGGWRVVMAPAPPDVFTLRIVPPGHPPSDGRVLPADGFTVTWLDDHRFGYSRDNAIHVYDVALDREVAAIPGPPGGRGKALCVAADGQHWFDTRTTGHTTRHLITNFGDRPWW